MSVVIVGTLDTKGEEFAYARDLIEAEAARALGRSAMRKVSDLVFEVLLANAGSFFDAGRGNYMDGADSALTFDGLAQAITLMMLQRDDEGNDLDLRPRTLLVPPELQTTARALLESEYLEQIGETADGALFDA